MPLPHRPRQMHFSYMDRFAASAAQSIGTRHWPHRAINVKRAIRNIALTDDYARMIAAHDFFIECRLAARDFATGALLDFKEASCL